MFVGNLTFGGGGIGLISALRLGHQWWCRVGKCAAVRTLVGVYDWLGADAY